MYSKKVKYLLDLCKQAKFKKCLDIISSMDRELNSSYTMAIIINCCNACVDKICSKNISEDDLFSLLNHIIFYIKQINEADLLSYIQSLFHILKLFVKQESYGLIAKMDPIIIPSFLPMSLPKKHSDTYQSSANLLRNFIVKTQSQEFECLLAICRIVSKMYSKTLNASALFNCSFCFVTCLHKLSCPIKLLESYYFTVLSLAKSNTLKVNAEDDFKYFLSHFSLIYLDIFEKFDFLEALNFYEKTLENAMKIFSKDNCVSVLDVMRFPLLLSPLNFVDRLGSLKKCRRSFINLESSWQQLVVRKLNMMISEIVLSYFKSGNDSEWCKISEVCQLEIIYIIWELGRAELLPKFSCPCGCLVEKNIYLALSYVRYIQPLIDISVQQKSTSVHFCEAGAGLLVQFCEDIKVLKKYNCKKWETAWNTLAITLYNMGTYIYQNFGKACLQYFYIVIKYFIKFEFCDKLKILKFSLSSAFLTACFYNHEHYKRCMAWSALGLILYPAQRNSLMAYWIKAKGSQRHVDTPEAKELQKVNLVSVFKCFKEEIDFFTDGEDFWITKSDKIDLLVLELEEYKKKWKSKVPMMSAFKELCVIANLDKIVEVIIDIFGDCESSVHEDVPKILQRVLEQYEERISRQKIANLQSMIILAILYHLNYKYRVADAIIKNTIDMERVKTFRQKTDEPPDAVPKDPSEDCNIVSSYDSLKLIRHFGAMKYLNKSLVLFGSVIKDDFDGGTLTKITSSEIYDSLIKIAMEYRLHRYGLKSLQALELALKVARSENNACNIVWAISLIIENSDFNKCHVKFLIILADKELDNIERKGVQNLQIILTYYICKARCVLYHDYKRAYRTFQMANELYDMQEDTSELKLIKCQLHMLHFKFVLLPCSFGIVDHKKSTMLEIHLANSTVYELFNSRKIGSAYEISILFDANEELVKFYHLLCCPREVRAYCKETIILAQEMVLPIRCAYYLVYLAHADLRSFRYDESQVKIDGLADILCLKKYIPQVDQENKPPPNTESDKDIIDLTSGMQEMVLDLPIPENYRKQFSPSSPPLVIQPFRLPTFVSHDEDCECFYCTSLEYHSLILEKARLDALLNTKRTNFMISNDFFHGALSFYKLCLKKYESPSIRKMSKFMCYELIPDFKKELLESYGFTLLDYSYHLMRTKDKTAALKITDKLINLVVSRKNQHVYLYNEALFQKLGYMIEVPSGPISKTIEMDSLCPEPKVVLKTPESKQSKVTFMVQQSPSYSLPKRRVKKCLPFNLSPDEDDSNNKLQEKKTPLSKQPKTPVPKIKIYSNDDSLLEFKNPPTAIHIFNDEAKKNKKKVAAIDDPCTSGSNAIPKTSVSLCPVNSESVLKTRTKLLTDKLRQSARKPEVTVSISEGSNSKSDVSDNKRKPSLMKNLFEQEETRESNVPQGGAVRRSTRNRKNL